MKRSFVILLHIGFWLCYGVLVAIILLVYYRTIRSADNQMDKMQNPIKLTTLFRGKLTTDFAGELLMCKCA